MRDARGVSAPEPIQRCPPPRFKVSLSRGARGAPVRHRFKVSLSRNKGLLSSDLRGHSSPIQKLFFSRDASGDAPSAPNSKPCFQETPGGCTFCLSAKTHVFETLKQTCNAMHGLILRKFEAKYSRVRHSFWSQICRHVKPETGAHVLSASMDV